MSSRRVAVVSGSNKGIGFATVRALCKSFDGDVYLTARNESLGNDAVSNLTKEGLNPKFHQLDITDSGSIDRLKEFLKKNYGGLDLLVNNAGMAFKNAATEPFAEQAEISVGVNYFGTLNTCKRLFPLLRPHARVVNVSSMASQMSFKKCSSDLQAKLKSPDLTMQRLEETMREFIESTKNGTFKQKGWPESAYGVSKIGVTFMTFIQQKELNQDAREDIVVNACCPGWVATDMSSHKGPKTVEQGADTPVYLALLPPNVTSPKGDFVSERKIAHF